MTLPFDNFDPITARYSLANAYALAKASDLAYLTQDQVDETRTIWGFTQAHWLDSKGTQGVVLSNDKIIVVAFRGTDDIWAWLTDAKIEMKAIALDLMQAHVHRGFFYALDSVWDDMVKAISTFQDNGQSLWITGHSLGGALACLAATSLSFRLHYPINGVYTYGQPRTGSFGFANKYDAELGAVTFRHVNDLDIVTRVPPRELGYSHVGQLKFFDSQGQLQDDDGWWNRFLRQVKVGVEGMVRPVTSIKDHSSSIYAGLFENLPPIQLPNPQTTQVMTWRQP